MLALDVHHIVCFRAISSSTGQVFLHLELESAGQSFRGQPDHMELAREGLRRALAEEAAETTAAGVGLAKGWKARRG